MFESALGVLCVLVREAVVVPAKRCKRYMMTKVLKMRYRYLINVSM